MISLVIALRSLARRKSRAVLIGLLVVFGTLLLVFGTTFTRSAAAASRASIIQNFTGDFIVYAASSREKPSPFAFTSPLPVVRDVDRIGEFLSTQPEVETWVPFAQNYSIVSVEKDGAKVEVPFIFYAVDPAAYAKTFTNAEMLDGDFLASGDGILVSRFQNEQYRQKYGIELAVGQRVTLLGLGDGGGVNAFPTTVRGIFEPRYYKNVFNYINFVDIRTYSGVYNFTGVARGSLPDSLEQGLAATSEDDIFALADAPDVAIDTTTLQAEAISGYTMIAVRLKDHGAVDAVRGRLAAQGFEVKTARWDEASGFFAQISTALQAFIYLATALIFLVVAFIFANTLIISIIERTGEIGTMRALGAEKSFVRSIFLSETLFLNVAASLAGILVSLVLILAAGRGGLPLPDVVSQFLIGGGPLPMVLAAGPFLTALAVVVAVSVLATISPIRVATRITPLAAMSDRYEAAMGFYLTVALKNVFRQKKRSFTLGINYAVVTFILALLFAFSQGASRNITSNLVRASAGHVTVSGSYSVDGRVFQGVRRYPEVAATAREVFGSAVTAIPRYAVRSSLFYNGISKRLEFTGIDPAADGGIRGQLRFLEGSWDAFAAAGNGISLPKDTAAYFGLALGDEVVISARTRFGAFNTGTLKVAGITETDNYFIQGLVLCQFAFLQSLDLAGADTASSLYLYFDDPRGLGEKRDALSLALSEQGFETSKPASASAAVSAVSSASPTYEVDTSGRDTIRLTLSTIDEAVGLVRTVTAAVNAIGALIALIMLFIIAVSVFINLRMTINERLREIGTMRTIGVEAGGITGLFVLENVFLALLFSLLGVAAALLVVGILTFGVRLPLGGAAALFLDGGRLVLVPRLVDLAAIVAVITAFAAVFSFFPARYGGKIRPVDALTRVF